MLPLKPARQSQPAGTLAPSELAGQSTEVHDLADGSLMVIQTLRTNNGDFTQGTLE